MAATSAPRLVDHLWMAKSWPVSYRS